MKREVKVFSDLNELRKTIARDIFDGQSRTYGVLAKAGLGKKYIGTQIIEYKGMFMADLLKISYSGEQFWFRIPYINNPLEVVKRLEKRLQTIDEKKK